MATTGLVLGKFLPPHLGHLHLIDHASALVDTLYVVVGTLAREPIPGALRFGWMQELAPRATVLHLTDENPQLPEEHPRFWEIWRQSLFGLLPAPPDLVFASEAYGHRLAAELGARFLPVDPGRLGVPVSGTRIRQAPLAHWEHLPRPVRPYFVRRVCLFGSESTGKSTLAARLAEHFGTCFVPEYARTLLEADPAQSEALVRAAASAGAPLSAALFSTIAAGQWASEQALARSAHRLLFCDTDALSTCVWSELFLGAAPPDVVERAAVARYDLTLLCDAEVPYAPDAVRYFPHRRAELGARFARALASSGRAVVELHGSWDERWRTAVRAVEALLRASP